MSQETKAMVSTVTDLNRLSKIVWDAIMQTFVHNATMKRRISQQCNLVSWFDLLWQ